MPQLYIVCGLPFAGKSTLTRELIRRRGCRRIDIDAINMARGIGIAGAVITPRQWADSYTESYRQLAAYLASGLPVAYEWHCWTRRQRSYLRALARQRGATTTLLYLNVPEATVRARWLANRADPRRHDINDHNYPSLCPYSNRRVTMRRRCVTMGRCQWRSGLSVFCLRSATSAFGCAAPTLGPSLASLPCWGGPCPGASCSGGLATP